jgi:hypothetical protein
MKTLEGLVTRMPFILLQTLEVVGLFFLLSLFFIQYNPAAISFFATPVTVLVLMFFYGTKNRSNIWFLIYYEEMKYTFSVRTRNGMTLGGLAGYFIGEFFAWQLETLARNYVIRKLETDQHFYYRTKAYLFIRASDFLRSQMREREYRGQVVRARMMLLHRVNFLKKIDDELNS